MKKPNLQNILRVAKYISKNPDTWVNDIARELDLYPITVLRYVNVLDPLIERKELAPMDAGLPNLPVLLKFRGKFSEERILRFLKLRKTITGVK